jgi:hypothetical protein
VGKGRRCRGTLKEVEGTPRKCEDHRMRYEGSVKVVVRITEEDDVTEEGMEDHRMRSEWKMWKTRKGDVEESLKERR